jgi:cytochrome P450 PksS
MSTLPKVNIASSEFKANPYPFYARLRAEAPVHRVVLPNKQPAWLITRYDDVLEALKDERLVKNPLNAMTPAQVAKQPWVPAMFKPLTRSMLDLDVPDHTRLRGLVHKVFTPRLIEQMRARISTLTNDLLDAAQRKGQIDLIRDYAQPVPTTIIAEMLGVPASDHHKFNRWSNAMIASSASGWGMVTVLPKAIAFIRYVRNLIDLRRANPQDDLISALVQAEEAGDQLSKDELLAMVFILLIAGHETTVNLIGNGTLALLEHPEQLALLRSDPGLIKTAIEELVRYHSPVEMATERYAREDVALHGVTIPRGELVFAVLASANRDAAHFADPDQLDITRTPNKHLGFGQGIHYCVGSPLARLEGQIAIATLLERAQDLKLLVAPGALRWRRGLNVRGLEALPLTLAQRRAA